MSIPTLGRGVIEGFYGEPWSHAARLRMLGALSRLGLETFVIAPKHDRRTKDARLGRLDHRERHELSELVAVARDQRIDLVIGISPERVFGKNAAQHALWERLADLSELGVSRIALTFDDTWATFVGGLASFERGLGHARLARRAKRLLREKSPRAEVFVAPAVYHKRVEELSSRALAYLRGLGALGGDVPAAWTGPNVFSRLIEARDVTRLSRATGLSIWIWNNAITNDWLPIATGEPIGLRPWQKLSFGPVENLGTGLAEVSRGILLNGAREPALTEISLAHLAELGDGDSRDARTHERAVESIVGPGPKNGMMRLYDLTKRHDLTAPSNFEAKELDARIRDAIAGRGSIEALVTELSALGSLEGELEESLDDREMWREIAPTLRKVTLAAQAARLCLERAQAMRSGERQRASALGRTIDRLLAEARALRWRAGVDVLERLYRADPRTLAQ